MSDQKVEMSLNLVQAVVNYLGSRPFVEVADLVMAIREQVTPQIQVPVSAPSEQDAPVQ
jgi:hypothetical protein